MKDKAGYIKLHRKITEWEWYHDTNTFRLFLHILLMANFTDGRFEGKVIKRGQLVTSLPSLSKQTGLSIRNVRTSLEHLFLTGELTVDRQPKYRVITVVKYDEYQSTDSLTDRESTGNRQATDSQPTVNRQQYKNNKNVIKEECKEEQEKEPTPLRGDVWFEKFWSAYPKKLSKQDALKAWKSTKLTEDIYRKIMASLERWKKSDQWQRENGQYIPYPATWIRKRRWEDDLPGSAPASAPDSRPAPRPSSAHNFDERDYSGEEWNSMSDLAAEMARFKSTGEVSV